MGQRVEKNLEVGQFGGNLCTKEREQRKQASKTKKERRKTGKPAEKLHFLWIFEEKIHIFAKWDSDFQRSKKFT